MEYWLSDDKKPVYPQKFMEFEKDNIKEKKRNFRDIVAKGIRYKAEIKTIDKKEVKLFSEIGTTSKAPIKRKRKQKISGSYIQESMKLKR